MRRHVGWSVAVGAGEIVGDLLGSTGEVVGDLLGSSVAVLINVQTFPLRHSVSPLPLLFPSTTIDSAVPTGPVQSKHFIAEEYVESLLFSEDNILPVQSF